MYVQRSADGGTTWSGLTEITAEVRQGGSSLNPGWRWYATGPAAAVTLTAGPHAGRIVVACDHTRRPVAPDTGAEARYRGQHLIWSDGGGRPGTWRIGAVSSTADVTVCEGETALTVLGDGRTLYANCRVHPGSRASGWRADAYSTDGGASYSVPMRPQASIVTSECQGSLLTLPDGRLVYAGPSLEGLDPFVIDAVRQLQAAAGQPLVTPRSPRAAMALRVSDDDGRSWRHAHTVSGLPAAYSSMTLLDPETIGLLYETGDTTGYRRIEFTAIPVTALG